MNVLLIFYGLFLIGCGVTSVLFIGAKAKTALISGGSSGLISILVGYFHSNSSIPFALAAILVPFMLFFVFSWRSTKTFFKLIELIELKDATVQTKAIAFLIISLMAVVSIFVVALQVVGYISYLTAQ